MDVVRLPLAVELFAQWCTARGQRVEAAARPFSRNWRQLLEDARIVSAIEERDAEHDARLLADDGWIEIKPVQYRGHLIDRISIPLTAEARWRDAFGFTSPTNDDAKLIREFSWQRELQFIPGTRLNLSFDELRQLDDFFRSKGHECIAVPIKERSLGIFGDEKRLDMLWSNSALFEEGRLTLDHLDCFVVPEPLGWQRGARTDGPVIILENLATWHTYATWDNEHRFFSATIYGGGKRFIDAVLSLRDVFAELGGQRRVFYFGDIDPAGLRIPRLASIRAQGSGLPPVEPDLWSYRSLLERAEQRGQQFTCEHTDFTDEDCLWLGSLAEHARAVMSCGKRIPQELLGWELLRILQRTNTE